MVITNNAVHILRLLSAHTKKALGVVIIFTYLVLVHGMHLLALTQVRTYQLAPADGNATSLWTSLVSGSRPSTPAPLPSIQTLTFPGGLPPGPVTVAICGGLTSAGIKLRGKAGRESPRESPRPATMTTDDVRGAFPLFTTFIPSFCKTASKGFRYSFYFAYDYTDGYFSLDHQMATFKELFRSSMKSLCHANITYDLTMVRCQHSKHPAWAQNDAVMEAYLDGAQYFYRVNDDTTLLTPGWTEAFISALAGFSPPNVGCVGPQHSGGNTHILTYDFTHSTHQDVFAFHYPRTFTDWYADDWITKVYAPNNMKKLTNQRLRHTMSNGMRYVRHLMGPQLKARLPHDRDRLQRYIAHHKSRPVERDGSKVISLLIHNTTDTDAMMGALHNTQLASVIFPRWVVRIYLLALHTNSTNHRILRKIASLGAQIYVVDASTLADARLAALSVITDQSVEHVLVRSARHRLDDRQKTAVDEWLASDKQFHHIKDHPNHANVSVVPGLFGIKTAGSGPLLYQQVSDALLQSEDLEGALWSVFSESTLCHDSVSCSNSSHSQPLGGVAVGSRQFIGQSYDRYMEPSDPGLLQGDAVSRCGRSIV